MNGILRRLRGAFGIGMKWAALWAVVGMILVGIIGVLRPDNIGPGEGPPRAATIFGILGLFSGIGFATVLSVAERRRTIEELPLWRVALWGFIGAAAIPLLMGADGTMWPVAGILGATFAAVSVAAARRGAAREVERS
jgi:hypothetical protein